MKTFLDCRAFENDIEGGIEIQVEIVNNTGVLWIGNYIDVVNAKDVKIETDVEQIRNKTWGKCVTCEDTLELIIDKDGDITMSKKARDHFRVIKADGSGEIVI